MQTILALLAILMKCFRRTVQSDDTTTTATTQEDGCPHQPPGLVVARQIVGQRPTLKLAEDHTGVVYPVGMFHNEEDFIM
jgi:hypothetical protein